MNAIQEEWQKMRIAYQIRYARMYKKVKENETNTDNHGVLLEMSYVLVTVFGLTAKQIHEIERNDGLTNADIDVYVANHCYALDDSSTKTFHSDIAKKYVDTSWDDAMRKILDKLPKSYHIFEVEIAISIIVDTCRKVDGLETE